MNKFPSLPSQISASSVTVEEIDFDAFKSMVYEGAGYNLGDVNDETLDRIIEELQYIEKTGLKDYFLFWKSLLDFCGQEKICQGPGRGVINSSIVAKCLGFTQVNAMEWKLPFQRFFNPVSGLLPAFTLDIPDDKREVIIEYLKNTYGKAHVGALAGRNDDESGIANISKFFTPAGSGVVISANALKPTVPTLRLHDGTQELIVDYPTKYLQNLGCIKFDIFGIKQLEPLQKLLEQKTSPIYPEKWNDSKVFDFILSSKSKDIFPFQNDIMRQFMKDFETDSIETLALAYAVSRPGLQPYIEGMKAIYQEENDSYFPHESLYEPLQSTYGYIVYKEQFLDIIVKMSGFGYDFADMMYRNLLEDDPQRHTLQFMDRCEQNGIDMSVIQQVMTELIASHPFLFSKAHALGVVMLGYTQIWHQIHGRIK